MNPPPLPLHAEPPKRTGWIVYAVIVTFFLFLSLLANLVLFAIVAGSGTGEVSLITHRTQFQEQFVQGDESARDKVVVVYLTGIIESVPQGSFDEEGMVGDIREQLRQAVDDKSVKAIIVRINSPGGEVVASDAIYNSVAEAREDKPVVASIDSVGASGAYYAAVGADYIMANELSITGSIGVILQSFTFGDLMTKIGVKSYTFKSGRYKDVLNPTREPTEDEKQLIQNLIMEVYDKFVGVVAEEREMDVDDLKSGLADGRILSGKQALDAGFVDGLGYFDDAVEKAKELAKIKEARVIRYVQPFSLSRVLRLFGQNERANLKIELSPQPLKLQSGKLYFLPPHMFQ